MSDSMSSTSTPSSRHLPPQSLEAERSVLGALLLDTYAYSKVSDVGLLILRVYSGIHIAVPTLFITQKLSKKKPFLDVSLPQ